MLVACVLATISTVESAQAPDLLRMFLTRRDEPVTTYRARRRLEAKNLRFKKEAWLEVLTTLDAAGFRYEIVDQGGSGMVRDRVLKAALDGEARLLKEPVRSSALTTDNYEFAVDGFDNGWARIRVKPRRKDTLLVDGWLLVSPADADLAAIGGRLSKNPSFWTTQVLVDRRYARIAGFRVPISIESTASVRIAGTSTFSMRYTYEVVNGVDVRR